MTCFCPSAEPLRGTDTDRYRFAQRRLSQQVPANQFEFASGWE
jgi:hypothetical protein